MRGSIRWIVVASAFLISPRFGYATTFPITAVGDIFSGSITIDPATPCSTCGPTGVGTYLGTYYNAGSIIVNLDGTEFAGTALYVEVLAENAGPDHCKH
jgi:hypothetical protein